MKGVNCSMPTRSTLYWKASSAAFCRYAVGHVNLHSFQATGRGLLHKDVAANVAQLTRHCLPVLGELPGDIKLGVNTADCLRMLRVAHQADGLSGNAEADGNFRAYRDKIEVVREGATAQA